jgi:hypothetical protein
MDCGQKCERAGWPAHKLACAAAVTAAAASAGAFKRGEGDPGRGSDGGGGAVAHAGDGDDGPSAEILREVTAAVAQLRLRGVADQARRHACTVTGR